MNGIGEKKEGRTPELESVIRSIEKKVEQLPVQRINLEAKMSCISGLGSEIAETGKSLSEKVSPNYLERLRIIDQKLDREISMMSNMLTSIEAII